MDNQRQILYFNSLIDLIFKSKDGYANRVNAKKKPTNTLEFRAIG
jgi:hypothetical protein